MSYFWSSLNCLTNPQDAMIKRSTPGTKISGGSLVPLNTISPILSDKPDMNERLRRNNIVVRFVSAFNRAKRRISERIPENKP